jgi:hypothetical protein
MGVILQAFIKWITKIFYCLGDGFVDFPRDIFIVHLVIQDSSSV